MYQEETTLEREVSRVGETAEARSAEAFRLALAGFGPEVLHVVRVRGREAISRPYVWEVTFTTGDPSFGASGVLGRPAQLTIAPLAEAPRVVLGAVARVTCSAGVEHGRRAYCARIVPRLSRLSRRVTSRVFEDRSVPEIVSAVLAASRIAHRWETRASYPRRAYCAQYRESDLAFVTRLCAEVGIWFRFDAPERPGKDATEVVTFGDSAGAPEIEGGPRLSFRSSHGGALCAQEEHVTSFEVRREVRPAAVTVRGYDFRRPTLPLEARAALGGDGGGELAGDTYEHGAADGGGSHADHEGAPVLLEQLGRDALAARAGSLSPRLAPGRRFLLEGHPGADGAYVITEVRHDGRAARIAGEGHVYENRFACLPAGVAPRPKRPRPRGRALLETAIVVGPEGSEIHTDEHGCVRVRFHWQTDPKAGADSACWARVVAPWAGASWGSQWIPRAGMEVLVSFLEGDPSRPVVLGCLRNAVHPAPFALPRDRTTSGIRTHSTPGGEGYNELAFQDAKGAEVLRLRAERDFDRLAQHDTLETTGHDATMIVGQDRSARIGRNDALAVGERLSIEVAGNARQEMSDDTIAHATGGGAGFVLAGGNASLQTKGDISLSAGGNIAIDAAGDITIKAGGTLTIDAGGAVVIVAGSIRADAGGAVVVTGGTVDLNP